MRILVLSLTIMVSIAGFPLAGEAVDQDLVLYLPFEEGQGDVTTDKSGRGNEVTLEGGPEWAQGKYGGGLELGGGSYVNVSDNATLDGMKQLTIELWVNLRSISGTLAAKTDWDTCFHSHFSAGGVIWWGYSVPDRMSAPAGTAVEGEWVHLALWFDGEDENLWKIYKNGEEVASGPAVIEEIPDTGDDFSIGGRKKGGSTIDGFIDEVAVYRRALSVDEIRQDMAGVQASVNSPGKLATVWGLIKRQ